MIMINIQHDIQKRMDKQYFIKDAQNRLRSCESVVEWLFIQTGMICLWSSVNHLTLLQQMLHIVFPSLA